MHAPPEKMPRHFGPGDLVRESGIYRVIHDGHRPVHAVCAIKGDTFPDCRRCKQQVRFELWMEADYLNQDWDLAGPNLKLAG